MSKDIIQAALIQEANAVEFNIRQSSMSVRGDAIVGGLTLAQVTAGYDELRMLDQITYLFRMI
jgi:hypothetical protein